MREILSLKKGSAVIFKDADKGTFFIPARGKEDERPEP
jgi:predicted RNA binding protein YcfA (HicA-like mRNA interferase family)